MRDRKSIGFWGNIQAGAKAWVQRTFSTQDFGRSITADELSGSWLLAALWRLSLSALSRQLGWVSDETLRKATKANLPGSVREILPRVVKGWQEGIPRALKKRKKGCRMAIDIHQRPYYGDHSAKWSCGGKQKQGTRWFITYATCVIVEKGSRWTIAATPMTRDDSLAEIVEILVKQVKSSGVRMRHVLLDREFYGYDVFSKLQGLKVPFLIPVIKRGKQTSAGFSGTSKFFQEGVKGWFEHTWSKKGRRNQPTVTVHVAAMKSGDGRKQLVYASFTRLRGLKHLIALYRKRFGIETSYRQIGQCMARTTSKDPVWRFVIFAIAIFLRNCWVAEAHHPPRSLAEMLEQMALLQHHDLDTDFTSNLLKLHDL